MSLGEPNGRFSIVCVAGTDWGAALPYTGQHIMEHAARRGHQVLYIEAGHFLGRHLWRLLRRSRRASLARRLFATERVASGIQVRKALNPLPWSHKYRFSSFASSILTGLVLRRLARRLPQPFILWIYDPYVAFVVGSLGESFAVYDCVDDLAEHTWGDTRRRAFVTDADERAASVSRLVFTTATPLYERHRRINAETYLVPNGCDYKHFSAAADPSTAAPEVTDFPKPVVGFAGNIVPYKVDFGLLETVATARPDWTLLLIGPAHTGTEGALARITRLANVHWLGRKRYEEIPRYIAGFDVGICPYLWNAATRSVFPLKLYEYLAAGKPVVASGCPDLAGMEPHVVLTRNADEFVAATAAALDRRRPAERAERAAIAAENSWETRTDRLLEIAGVKLRGVADGSPSADSSS